MLELSGITVRYGEAVAVKEAALRVEAGQWVTLIGPNGAGKSSLIKACLGVVKHGGTVTLDGEDLTALPSWERQKRGFGYVPEGRRLFPRLSVEENLRVGAYLLSDADVRRGLGQAYELFPRLFERRTQAAGTLSGGEQQMLAISRALMGRPKILVVDEASLGLMPLNVQLVFKTLARLHSGGLAILLVEQNARIALRHAEHAYVMETGLIVLHGTPAEIASDPRILESYVGA